MHLIISNNSEIPIYEQIITIFKNAILSGEITEGEALPSVRGLAKDLKISFLTVKKAYDELEDQGYIKTIQGKGSFVSPRNKQLAREEYLKECEKHIDEAIKLSRLVGLSNNEFEALVKALLEE